MRQDTSKWGKATAKSRYGSHPTFSPPSESEQAIQCPEDKHGPKYDNDSAGWVRGAGGTATNKPGFDKGR